MIAARFRSLSREFLAYGLCSVAALAVDYGLLIGLTSLFGVNYLLASATGFLSGLVVVYALTTAFVFRPSTAIRGSFGFGWFLLTGLAGLLLTQVLMLIWVGGLGLSVTPAKAATAGLVFMFNYLSRRAVFGGGRGEAAAPRRAAAVLR